MNIFCRNNSEYILSLLKNIVSDKSQSRTLLFVGKSGWGKVACALDVSQYILKENPLTSSDLFYFRNDQCVLKTDFFLNHCPNTQEAWTWLYLLQRRINMINLLDENISIPTGIKLPQLKEQLDEYIFTHQFPDNIKFINQLLQFMQVLNKKSGIPISVVRESIKFHSIQSEGRISIIADFDTADHTSQNAILKLIEEPNPNHWIILTAQDEKNILPTILSRTLKISFKKPLSTELSFFNKSSYSYTSSIDIMRESVEKLSEIKLNLLDVFFAQCTGSIEHGIDFLQFSEQLSQKGHSLLFLEELLKCFNDSLRLRQNNMRNSDIPVLYPEYKNYSMLFINAVVSEIEETVSKISELIIQISRSVIKDDYILPAFLLEISRMIRRIN